ncbi:MAG: hypothetical protein HFH68_14480 [Lachnospiraceae bacterium]|nr:hypothetical protein [Lachnospiraceae bacterium]
MKYETYNVTIPVRKGDVITELTRAIAMSEINATIIKIPKTVMDIKERRSVIRDICDKYKDGDYLICIDVSYDEEDPASKINKNDIEMLEELGFEPTNEINHCGTMAFIYNNHIRKVIRKNWW